MSPNPVNGLLRVVAVALDAKVVLAVVREVALGVGTEARRAGSLGHIRRVRQGQGHGADGVLDNVETLEACGGRVRRGEAQTRSGIGTGAVDCPLVSIQSRVNAMDSGYMTYG